MSDSLIEGDLRIVDLQDRPGEVVSRINGLTNVVTSALGANPIYTHMTSAGIEVAMRISSLVEAGVSLELDRGRIDSPGPRSGWPEGHASYIRDVDVIPAGRDVSVKDGVIFRDESFEWEPDQQPLTPQRLLDILQSALAPAAEVSDVRVLMSGGLDSSLLAAVLHMMGIPFSGIVIEDPACVEDVASAQALADELHVDLEVVSITPHRFNQLITQGVAVFEDLRPDLFCAAGLIEVAHRSRGADLLVGGEPADAILGGLRSYAETSDDDERNSMRLKALVHQAPRDVFLLSRAADDQGIKALSPYAYGPLVRAAMGTPWDRLLRTEEMLLPDSRLGGPGYKLLQRRAADILGYASLRALSVRPKAGLPSSVLTNWQLLKELAGADATPNLEPLWQLGAAVFEKVVFLGIDPDDVNIEDLLRQRRSSGPSAQAH